MSVIPQRKPSINKASRAQGEYSIGPATPTIVPEPAPTLTVVQPTTPPSTPTSPTVKAMEPLVETELTKEALLATPVITTNISLDQALNASIRRLRIELKKQGYRVTIGAIVSHASAAAFENHAAWAHTITPDARRSKGAPVSESAPKRRTSLNIPAGIPAAAELMVWKLSEDDSVAIPSITSVQMAALRWGLANQETWLPALVSTK